MITIEEGRKAYNMARSGYALEKYKMNDHESQVEDFFKRAMLSDPIRTARVFDAHPVLTERQLEDRRERELYAFGPEDGDNDEDVTSLTAVASLRAHDLERERVRLAELRGEPV